MGQTLNQTTGLDIDTEIKVVEQRLNELKNENASNEKITLAMKDLGIQRSLSLSLSIYIYIYI